MKLLEKMVHESIDPLSTQTLHGLLAFFSTEAIVSYEAVFRYHSPAQIHIVSADSDQEINEDDINSWKEELTSTNISRRKTAIQQVDLRYKDEKYQPVDIANVVNMKVSCQMNLSDFQVVISKHPSRYDRFQVVQDGISLEVSQHRIMTFWDDEVVPPLIQSIQTYCRERKSEFQYAIEQGAITISRGLEETDVKKSTYQGRWLIATHENANTFNEKTLTGSCFY
jgi:hypothetical protein